MEAAGRWDVALRYNSNIYSKLELFKRIPMLPKCIESLYDMMEYQDHLAQTELMAYNINHFLQRFMKETSAALNASPRDHKQTA